MRGDEQQRPKGRDETKQNGARDGRRNRKAAKRRKKKQKAEEDKRKE